MGARTANATSEDLVVRRGGDKIFAENSKKRGSGT